MEILKAASQCCTWVHWLSLDSLHGIPNCTVMELEKTACSLSLQPSPPPPLRDHSHKTSRENVCTLKNPREGCVWSNSVTHAQHSPWGAYIASAWTLRFIRSSHSCGNFFQSWPAVSRRMRAGNLLRTCWLRENWVELRNQGNFQNSWVFLNSPKINILIQRAVIYVIAAKPGSSLGVAFREKDSDTGNKIMLVTLASGRTTPGNSTFSTVWMHPIQ